MSRSEFTLDPRVALICQPPQFDTDDASAYELRHPSLLVFYPDGTHETAVFASEMELAKDQRKIDEQTAQIADKIDIGFRLCEPPELML